MLTFRQSLKVRHLEENLQEAFSKTQATEQELTEQGEELIIIQEKLFQAEEDVRNARTRLENGREMWLIRPVQALDDAYVESQKHSEHLPEILHQHSHAESPMTSSQNKSTGDTAGYSDRRNSGTSTLGLITVLAPLSDRPMGYWHPGQRSQISGSGTPQLHDPLHNVSRQVLNNDTPETSFAHTDQQYDFFDGVVTPATPERTIDDMISVSTAAAGPSVQVVERMSAAVRRLESENASSRDELDRLSAQRDEAREQVVSLMAEVEEKRTADVTIKALQAEMAEINQRYQTTLEMLGEKSELVEELRADVADVKQMYRELVDRTMQ